MISQERFEELVTFARKGQLETMEAIKLAVHESVADEQAKNAELLSLLVEFLTGCGEYASFMPSEKWVNRVRSIVSTDEVEQS
jgi:hypothetical protein